MKIVSICQPHFIPWFGYFKMINECDKFIFLDNVQYNRRSWQNRVHIRSTFNSNEKKYLSLSVVNNSRSNNINQIYLMKKNIEQFKNQVKNSYQNTLNFEIIISFFEKFFEKNICLNLSDFNILLINEICKILKIDIDYIKLSEMDIKNYRKQHLILEILQQEKADIYLSNIGSKNYVHESFFEKHKIKVIYNEFDHPVYDQNGLKKFIPNLSIIDLLFNSSDPYNFFKYKNI